MAVQPDATTVAKDLIGQSTHTFSHTCTGSDLDLFVDVFIDRASESTTSVTYAGVALSRLAGLTAGARCSLSRWVWDHAANGPVPTGTNDVVVTLSQSEDWAAEASSFTGVNQTTPRGTPSTNSGASTTPSVVVASAEGELVVDAIVAFFQTVNPTPDASQSALSAFVSNAGVSDPAGGSSTKPGAASVTMQWTLGTSRDWAALGVALKPASAGGSSASGGSNTTVNVTASGAGTKHASGGSSSTVQAAATGAGAKTALGGSQATVNVTATGGGQVEGGAGAGGSAALVQVTASGGGFKTAAGGSAAGVTVAAAGSGQKTALGGAAAVVSVDATGGGMVGVPDVPEASQGVTPPARELSHAAAARDFGHAPAARRLTYTVPARD